MSITVVTITRNRPGLLARAIRSVAAQERVDRVEHLVVVDDCAPTFAFLRHRRSLPDNLRWIVVSRSAGEVSGPGRSSRLRNLAVRVSEAEWIAFLDDDNEYTPDHLASLLARARATGCRAVHSHLVMLNQDGSPYLEQRSPWSREEAEGRAEYARMLAAGVVSVGSCVRRDRLDPLDVPDPVVSVDTGEWLLARELLLEVPFRDEFDADDAARSIGEDDKFARDLQARGEPVACTGKPTLRYYLGGYSNNFSVPFDSTFSWC
ncbi:Glycosyl transferase family 2 [Streptoalloteichus tenebrarius]|uniref:AmgE n=2 Tax=Actinomycetes TaxID=1760 RepID=C5HYQ9_9ACTN|nr:glycosyltransferase family 2 protein [Streptoalloteichus tenebrarius]ACR82898.1 AmgE [Streptomyces sp. KCTC 9047]MCP2258274.1 Glycosyl transferase family 2 [Streptoalloteichus tenebrarius]BFF04495.1 hypothetical protein GCM10020241_61700 [Streptoalloteichus tenebrarius]